MAITHTKYESGGSELVTGKIIADGAAANVSIGFIPSFLIIINYTNPSTHFWTKGMTDAYEHEIGATGTQQIVTSAGISDYAGDNDQAPGFTIGTNSVLNTSSDVLYYVAFR